MRARRPNQEKVFRTQEAKPPRTKDDKRTKLPIIIDVIVVAVVALVSMLVEVWDLVLKLVVK